MRPKPFISVLFLEGSLQAGFDFNYYTQADRNIFIFRLSMREYLRQMANTSYPMFPGVQLPAG